MIKDFLERNLQFGKGDRCTATAEFLWINKDRITAGLLRTPTAGVVENYVEKGGAFRPEGRELDQIRALLLVGTYLPLLYITQVRLM